MLKITKKEKMGTKMHYGFFLKAFSRSLQAMLSETTRFHLPINKHLCPNIHPHKHARDGDAKSMHEKMQE